MADWKFGVAGNIVRTHTGENGELFIVWFLTVTLWRPDNGHKRVDDIMSGYIARTKADEILEQGIEKGVDIGGDEVASALNYLYMNNREDEAREAMRDKTVRTRILEEYRLREASKKVEQFAET